MGVPGNFDVASNFGVASKGNLHMVEVLNYRTLVILPIVKVLDVRQVVVLGVHVMNCLTRPQRWSQLGLARLRFFERRNDSTILISDNTHSLHDSTSSTLRWPRRRRY
jgi:hypothetical protein